MIKHLAILVLLLGCATAHATTIQVSLQDASVATGILDLEIGTETYDILFELVTGNHNSPDPRDIFQTPVSDSAGAEVAARAIRDAINVYNALPSTDITSVGETPGSSTDSYHLPFLYDPSAQPQGCEDLCTQKGSKSLFNNSWNWSEASLLPTEDANFARFTVSTVPVPPAVYLFGSGIVGLIGIARRRRSGSSQI